jgi:peptidoglycan/LPS O-acetylase OafA/YrhL
MLIYGIFGYMFVACAEIYRFRGDQPEESHISYGIFSALIVFGLVELENSVDKFYRIPILRKIGDASYVLYLIHFPIVSFSAKIFPIVFGLSVFSALLCILITTVGCIWLSIYIHDRIERPLLSLLNRTNRRKSMPKLNTIG